MAEGQVRFRSNTNCEAISRASNLRSKFKRKYASEARICECEAVRPHFFRRKKNVGEVTAQQNKTAKPSSPRARRTTKWSSAEGGNRRLPPEEVNAPKGRKLRRSLLREDRRSSRSVRLGCGLRRRPQLVSANSRTYEGATRRVVPKYVRLQTTTLRWVKGHPTRSTPFTEVRGKGCTTRRVYSSEKS